MFNRFHRRQRDFKLTSIALALAVTPAFISAALTVSVSISLSSAAETRSKPKLASKHDRGGTKMETSEAATKAEGEAPEGKDMVEGAAFIDKWHSAASSLASYVLSYKMTVFNKSSETTETGKLWYKKPGLMKIEEQSGPKAGAVAILGRDGKVKAHPGGVFRSFTVKLEPDSHFLKCANGWPMVESDYVSLAKACQGYVKEGVDCKVSKSPAEIHGRQALIMEMHKDGKIYKRALFDPQTTLPFEWWDYTDGHLYAHSLWTNFETQELADSTFTMKGEG